MVFRDFDHGFIVTVYIGGALIFWLYIPYTVPAIANDTPFFLTDNFRDTLVA